MARKNRLPKFPNDYLDSKAEEYTNSKWMRRNQNRTTLQCIKYLHDINLDNNDKNRKDLEESSVILDLGCGSGFSSEILVQNGFRVIGIDVLKDMILKARNSRKISNNYYNLELILADINHLPLKNNKIDHIISVSSYNFITYGLENFGEKVKLLNDTAKALYDVLKSKGRIVIEFYPKDEKELEMFNKSFINNNFEGYMVKKNPHQKSGQTFLLLKKKI